MMKTRNVILVLAALLMPLMASAQYVIYPVPHSQTAGTGGNVAFTPTVNIVSDNGIDEYTRQRAMSIFTEHGFAAVTSANESQSFSNVYLGVAGGEGKANAAAGRLSLDLGVLSKSGKFDRHVLALTNAGGGVAQLVVIGENTDATFMGLASLEQMLDAGAKSMPTVTISDYADLKERGIIEGFYGKPYSCEVRKDLLRFMMRNKMNCYVYGPKSDVYHSGKWAEAYPTELTETQRNSGFVTQQDLREFTEVAHQTKVSVVWAVHPGNSLLNDDDVVDKIVGKFAKMYGLGFRQFAVFADDVSIPSSQSGMQLTASRISAIQQAIENRWNTAASAPADTVKPLRFTPQIYCRNFAGSQWQFNTFFKALSAMPSNVTVYYTGGGVWSVPNNSDLSTVQTQFGRNVIWWWNYPCNDNGTGPSEIYPLDMISNFNDMPNVDANARLDTELTAGNQGILCNPMEQGSAARTAIFSAGDYSWNNRSFDNSASWEASFRALFPGRERLQKAYRFLAPYLSKNDPASLNTAIEAYKKNPSGSGLGSLMQQIVDNCDILGTMEHSDVVSDSLLYADIRPWVLRLRAMASAASGFMASREAADAEGAWASCLPSVKLANTLSSADDFMTNHMSGFGTDGITTSQRLTHASWRYLTPFVTTYLGKHALDGILPSSAAADTVFTNAAGAKLSLAETKESVTLKGTVTLPTGGYAGFALAQPTKIKQISIAQQLFDADGMRFMWSTDGKDWAQMENNTLSTDAFVHYVAALNAGGKPVALTLDGTQMQLALYSSTPEKVSRVTPPAYNYWDNHTAARMTDGDYSTFTCLNRDMVVGDTYTLELSAPTEIENVRVCMGTTNGDYPKAAAISVSADNKTWTTLSVKGARTREYSMSLSQNVKVATEPSAGTDVMALDFVPTDDNYAFTPVTAKYVRLQVTEIWDQPKWMRLHEIEVNGLPTPVLTPLTDADGNNMEAATDADGTTFTDTYLPGTEGGGRFIYRFLSAADAKSLTLFCDETTVQGVKYSVSTDGATWQSVTPEGRNGVLTFTFGGEKKPRALQLQWDNDVIPAVYEAVEQADPDAGKPQITGISAVGGNAATDVSVSVEGGILVARSAVGLRSVRLYITDGRCILSQSLGGAHTASLPVATADGKIVVVKVSLTDGREAVCKVKTDF